MEKNIEKILNPEIKIENPTCNSQMSDENYTGNKMRVKHSKGYKDYFGMAVSENNRIINSPEAKKRKHVASTFEEQTERARQAAIENRKIAERAKAEKKAKAERIQFAGWSGSTAVIERKGHFMYVVTENDPKPVTE